MIFLKNPADTIPMYRTRLGILILKIFYFFSIYLLLSSVAAAQFEKSVVLNVLNLSGKPKDSILGKDLNKVMGEALETIKRDYPSDSILKGTVQLFKVNFIDGDVVNNWCDDTFLENLRQIKIEKAEVLKELYPMIESKTIASLIKEARISASFILNKCNSSEQFLIDWYSRVNSSKILFLVETSFRLERDGTNNEDAIVPCKLLKNGRTEQRACQFLTSLTVGFFREAAFSSGFKVKNEAPLPSPLSPFTSEFFNILSDFTPNLANYQFGIRTPFELPQKRLDESSLWKPETIPWSPYGIYLSLDSRKLMSFRLIHELLHAYGLSHASDQLECNYMQESAYMTEGCSYQLIGEQAEWAAIYLNRMLRLTSP